MKKITDVVSDLARPIAEKLGLEIWDVEYVKEAGEWFLRVYIDKSGGVSIEDCESVSRELDPILDESDPIPGSYTFEVSSAGAERVLKRPSDFSRFMGSLVAIKLYSARDGRKEYKGTMAEYQNGDIRLDIDGREVLFEKKEIALVRLSIG